MATSEEGARPVTGGAVLRQQVTDAITEAAFAELAETGYARTSMDAVARRAGVGKAALYRRWSSKAELVMDALALVKPAVPSIHFEKASKYRLSPSTPGRGSLASCQDMIVGSAV